MPATATPNLLLFFVLCSCEHTDMAEILYGRNAVREALRARRRTFQRLLVSSGAQEIGVLSDVVKLAEQAHVPIVRIDRHDLDRQLRQINHQGVALECSDYPYAEL